MTDSSRVRVSIVGVVIVALFCSLLARLWFLQMGEAEDLKVQAVARSTRVVQTEMPRGRILDRNGVVLVDNRAAWSLTIDRQLENATRARVIGQLAELLAVPPEQLEANFHDLRQSPLKPAIVAVDVPEPVRLAVLEHIEDFPGTRVQKLTVRTYPQGMLAAHILGYVGEISEEELAARVDRGYQEGDEIGRAGAERAYEDDLRGTPRRERLEVDPTGQPVGAPIDVRPGEVGDDVHLTIDTNIQRSAEDALRQGIESARNLQNTDIEDHFETLKAPAGSVVVLDVNDGSIAAMASNPNYDPAKFVDGISETEWTQLNDDPNHPLVDRATQGQYAPGSTFKLVSAVAAARYGVRGPNEWINDQGSVEIGNRFFRNDESVRHGRVNLARALTVSSDVYFYTAGHEFWKRWKAGGYDGLGIQAVAAEFGFGSPTGVELDEASGRIPDPDYKRELAEEIWDTPEQRRENGTWYPGDNVNTAVGQGDTTVTPLQLANAYATFANGGRRLAPHIGAQVRDADGNVVREVAPEQRGEVAIDATLRQQMQIGFDGVVRSERGTAAGAFAGFPFDAVPVAGKTGTAQVHGKGPTSLFAAYFTANGRQYAAVAVIEEAGRGSQVAAPIVRKIIEAMTGQLAAAAPVAVGESGRD
jgi:penicillin-binding protein 2